MHNIYIDISNISDKADLFEIFSQTFSFPSYFWKNWDAFEEILSDLDFEKITGDSHTGIHLILFGYDEFKDNFPKLDRKIFESILDNITSPESFLFTFEMK